MADSFVGEIRMFAGNFAPQGWAFCDGSLLSISENDVLFNLIGTTYGGDGQNTFGLPDLRGRIPVHQGASSSGTYTLGQQSGSEQVTLTATQIPLHKHGVSGAATPATTSNPRGNVPAAAGVAVYAPASATVTAMSAGAISGGSSGNLPHDNRMPYLCVSFIISLFGVYPSQS